MMASVPLIGDNPRGAPSDVVAGTRTAAEPMRDACGEIRDGTHHTNPPS
jgi:hypothetical protein